MSIRATPLRRRAQSLDWQSLGRDLDTLGHAIARELLTPAECDHLSALYGEAPRFRSRVIMARHGFGMGEYQYFAYPLPAAVLNLREMAYPPLAAIANRWRAALGDPRPIPTRSRPG